MALINCPECKREISDKAKSCPHCGFSMAKDTANSYSIDTNTSELNPDDILIKEDDTGNKKNKFYDKKLIVTISIGILLGALILYCFNSTYYSKFIKAIKDENTQEAIKIFNELENDKHIEKIEDYLKKEAGTIKDKYLSNSISYDEAINKLNIIKDINVINGEVLKNKKFIEGLNNSRIAYENTVKCFESNKFKDAIIEANDVIREDENYNSAIEYKNNAMEKLENEVIIKSKELASKNDFIGALNILEDNKNYIKNKESIDELLEEYKKHVSVEIINLAVDKAESGDFDEALDILKTNSSYSANNNIQEKINEIEKKKREYNKNVILDIKKRITINYDDVEKEYKIAPKGYSTRYVNISTTINIEPRMTFGNSPIFILNIGFQQSDWIFFETAIFSIDGTRTEWNINYFDKGSQVGNGIAEWYPVVHSELLAGYNDRAKNLKPLMDSIIGSQNATIRFQGHGYRDHKITNNEKQTLKDLWNLYLILEEEPSFFDLLK